MKPFGIFIVLLGFFLLLSLNGIAQTTLPSYVWVNTIGTTSNDQKILGLTVDASGATYICGSFEGTVDFDPGAGVTNKTAIGIEDCFLAKYNSAGNLVWVNTFGGPGSGRDAVKDVVTDALGNVYVTGLFTGPAVDFGGGGANILASAGTKESIFWAKYASSGICTFVKRIGNGLANGDSGNSIVFNANNIYITGAFSGTNVDFNLGGTAQEKSSNGVLDIFIAKYSDTGTFGWVTTIGGAGMDEGKGIDADPLGNIYITGSYNGANVDFNPPGGTLSQQLTSNGGGDIFVVSFNSFPSFRFVTGVGSTGEDTGNAIRYAGNNGGTIYVTGSFNGTADFNPVGTTILTSNGAKDAFLASYETASGDLFSCFNVGSSGNDAGMDVFVDRANGTNLEKYVYITGNFSGTDVDFDPGVGTRPRTSNGNADIFLSKYRDNGTSFEYHWTGVMGNASDDFGTQLFVSNHLMLLGGYFASTSIDFDPTPDGTLTLNNSDASGTTNDMFFGKYFNRQVVVSAADAGSGTLRQAITDLNSMGAISGSVPITFDIQGAGPFTIALASTLPIINKSAFIDGYTQTGATPATSPTTPANLQISINGGGSVPTCFAIHSANTVIRGLHIDGGFTTGAINLNTGASDCKIYGNHIGTNIQGLDLGAALSNAISIVSGTNHMIGGNIQSMRNVIAISNPGSAINIVSNSNTVQGNYIGIKADKSGDLLVNGIGISFTGSASNNVIGGISAGDANVIVQCSNTGINFAGASNTQNVLRGNRISCNGGGANPGIILNSGNGNITPPTITTANTAIVSGGGTNTGDIVDVYTDNSGCTPAQALSYVGSVTATGATWVLTGLSLNVGDIVTANITRTQGTSAFSTSASTTALAPEPTIQPTNLVFSNVTSSSLTGSFTAATIVPSGYIIIRRLTASAATAPLDGVSYIAGSAIVAGQIVVQVNASATITFTDSGLSASTGYSYDIYAFNGSTTNINYLTVNPLTGNITTLPPAGSMPNAPTLLNLDITSGTISVDLSWVDNANNEFNFEIERSANDNLNFRKIATNNADIVKYKDNSVQAGILYYYRVRATNGAGQSAYTEVLGAVVGVLVTGIDDNLPKVFKVYPNPSQDIFNIETDTPFDLSKAELRNAAGQLIENVIVENNYPKSTLDLSNQAKGLYILYIPNGNDKIVLKLIKE